MEQILKNSVKQLFDIDINVVLTRPEPQFGDYATNIALQLAGRLGRNPHEIAEQIAEILRRDERCREVSVAGPGFINLYLTDRALLDEAMRPLARPFTGKTILVEYSQPNPFKPLHAGHLYTTLVGDVIARLVENAGADTTRINYGGDVGLHVGRCMWGILQYLGGEYPDKLADIPEDDRATWMGECYVTGTSAYETDENAKAEIIALNKRVYTLHDVQDTTSAFARTYWTCREWSYDYFKLLYKELEVVPFDRYIPESEVTPLGVATVREQLQNGVYTMSENAVVFDGDTYGLHTRVFINSAGVPTYEAKDVGLSLTKWRDYPDFDQSIITTSNEQEQYMQVVLKSIEQFAPEPARRTRHITHGFVKLSGGVKMSSRKGNILLARDIVRAATAAAEATGRPHAQRTALAAIKYAFAKSRIGGDIVFDPSESVALDGNSGPYIQYAHARACSIISKGSSTTYSGAVAFDVSERSLLRKLGEYSDAVLRATTELLPHGICTYLFELAQEFNRFYETSHVIGSDREAIRLRLVELYRDTLASGLGMIGIDAPEHM